MNPRDKEIGHECRCEVCQEVMTDCPHLVTDREGTRHCKLAEQTAGQLAALIAERDKLRTALERIANQFHNTQAEEYSEAGEMISIATVALESKSLGAHLPD